MLSSSIPFLALVLAIALFHHGATALTAPSLPKTAALVSQWKLHQTATNATLDDSLEQALQEETTLLSKLGGKPALEAAVTLFYDKVVADPELVRFFEGTNLDQLKQHQYKFMELAFTEIPHELDVTQYISDAHKRLLEQEGLNASHFDLVAGHLVATLQELGVTDELVDEVVARVGPLRGVFETDDKEE